MVVGERGGGGEGGRGFERGASEMPSWGWVGGGRGFRKRWWGGERRYERKSREMERKREGEKKEREKKPGMRQADLLFLFRDVIFSMAVRSLIFFFLLCRLDRKARSGKEKKRQSILCARKLFLYGKII